MIENILESFRLDSLGEYESFIYEDTTDEMMSYIKEAQTGTTKKNIFQKLFDLIKKIFAAIGRAFAKFVKWVKSLFTKKTKTANQCLEDAGIKANTDGKSSKSFSSDKSTGTGSTGGSSNTGSTDGGSNTGSIQMTNNSKTGLSSIKVPIKSLDDKGHITTSEIEMNIARGIKAKIIDDKFEIKYDKTMYGYVAYLDNNPQMANSTSDLKVAKQKNANEYGTLFGMNLMFAIIDDQKVQNTMKEIISILEEIVNTSSNDNNEINFLAKIATLEGDIKLINLTERHFSGSKSTIIFDVKNLDIVSSILYEINNLLSKFNMIDASGITKDPNLAKRFIACLDGISSIGIHMQFGINYMTGLIASVWDVDPEYFGACKNVESLSRAVQNMVEANIPSKYVARAVHLISNDDLCAYSDINHPMFGQSRLAIFPKDKSKVYKIAINSLGKKDMKVDLVVWNKIKDTRFKDLFVGIDDITQNGFVETMERINSSERIKSKASFNRDLDELVDKVESPEFRKAVGFTVNDVHKNNVGYKGNKMKVLDYGQIEPA